MEMLWSVLCLVRQDAVEPAFRRSRIIPVD